MKKEFNLDEARGCGRADGARLGAGRAFLSAVLLLLLAGAVPAFAQQSDSASTPQPTPSHDAPAATVNLADPPPDDSSESIFPHFKDTRFWLSGQANFIFQTHPDFHAPYSGIHSLNPHYEKATSRLLTLYTGVRLNNSTEVLVDIEEAGGAALTQGFGLAGNTDLDIVRNPSLSKAPYLGRGMIHHVFALSQDKVENQRNAFSLFDELPRRRLEVRFGKFSMPDFFDVNAVGSDTKFQFINWTTDNNGAWDYAADTRGYTVGAVADFEDRNWGFRFAEALMPKVANGIDLVWKPWQAHGENYEFELRRGVIPKKAGVVRLLAYSNSANMGIYRDQVIKAAESGTAADITNHFWRITRKYGFGINVEQNLSHYLTAFARFGWDDGRTESFAYTEVDQTFAEGVGANGAWWHRKQDRAGIAFVSNAIKKDHQNYLNAGGLGFLLGDGHLNYGRENILETYYTVHVWRGIYLAPGVQHINNPGYNRDRGPVTVPSFRAHVEF
ncbi:MAG TPA: carbohydrate porin [Candidatus Dormibacteraeota bacterium]|nr:carbohydrate porin [Candidatus Dormibacteraeota bacterium]